MATGFYDRRRPQSKPNTARRNPRPFGHGLEPRGPKVPQGMGWFDPTERESRADRLTLAELKAMGREPVHTSDDTPSAAFGQPNLFAAYLEATATGHARHGSPHGQWLAAHLRQLAHRARFNDAHDGPTLDEREEAWDAASADRWASARH